MKNPDIKPKELVAVPIPKEAYGWVIDPGIEYLTFKIPILENWVTDEELSNPVKLDKYLKRTEGLSQSKMSGIKFPYNGKIIGKVSSATEDQISKGKKLNIKWDEKDCAWLIIELD